MDVMVVDDEMGTRTAVTGVLENTENYNVTAVGDGAAALEAIQVGPVPPLIIMDWIMPGFDGVQLCRKIRSMEFCESPYILMLTVRNNRENLVRALDAGADDYMVKPFDPDELRARLRAGKRIVQLQHRLARRVNELKEAARHIRDLEGLLPICSFCKRIRDGNDDWHDFPNYINQHTDITLTHGVCPDCIKEHYPGLNIQGCDERTE
ncbi:MAG: response regulator [Planctomycetota bacterium]